MRKHYEKVNRGNDGNDSAGIVPCGNEKSKAKIINNVYYKGGK